MIVKEKRVTYEKIREMLKAVDNEILRLKNSSDLILPKEAKAVCGLRDGLELACISILALNREIE
jgi:hypothetical protein